MSRLRVNTTRTAVSGLLDRWRDSVGGPLGDFARSSLAETWIDYGGLPTLAPPNLGLRLVVHCEGHGAKRTDAEENDARASARAAAVRLWGRNAERGNRYER